LEPQRGLFEQYKEAEGTWSESWQPRQQRMGSRGGALARGTFLVAGPMMASGGMKGFVQRLENTH
jgi:hypothetical protein